MTILIGGNGGNLPTVRLGTAQEVAFGATSSQSGTVAATTRLVRLAATASCRIALGTNPTAAGASALLPAGVVEFTEIIPGDKVAVIQESAGGKLSITECIIETAPNASKITI